MDNWIAICDHWYWLKLFISCDGSSLELKEEMNQVAQEHDLKGAASLFTLTNCSSSVLWSVLFLISTSSKRWRVSLMLSYGSLGKIFASHSQDWILSLNSVFATTLMCSTYAKKGDEYFAFYLIVVFLLFLEEIRNNYNRSKERTWKVLSYGIIR